MDGLNKFLIYAYSKQTTYRSQKGRKRRKAPGDAPGEPPTPVNALDASWEEKLKKKKGGIEENDGIST